MVVLRTTLLALLARSLAHAGIVLDPPDTLTLLEHMLTTLERELEVGLEIGTLTGLLLHLVYSTLPSTCKRVEIQESARRYLEHVFPYELSICSQALREVNQHLISPLPVEEAYNILGIFKQVDIFIHIGHVSPAAVSISLPICEGEPVFPEKDCSPA